MRAEILRGNETVFKRVEASEELYTHVEENLGDYRVWLEEAGFKTPDTKVTYTGTEIVFKQKQVDPTPSTDVEGIVLRISGMSFNRFGLDSNPNNFLGSEPHFVDFFPFLTRDEHLLTQQFDYGPEIAVPRYFQTENVLAFYSARLFKTDPELALRSIRAAREVLLSRFDGVLPREKMRLYAGIRLTEEGAISEYPQVYEFTRYLGPISEQDVSDLRDRIEAL